RYWSRLRCCSCWCSYCSCSSAERSSCTSLRSSDSWLSRSWVCWVLLAWASSRATRSARLIFCACAGVAATRAATTSIMPMARRCSIYLAGAVDDFHATVLRPAALGRLGADRTLFAVAHDFQLAGRTTGSLQGRVDGIAAALAQGLVVGARAALVGVALQGDAGGRTVTQVLGVAADDGLELRLQGVLVEVEVHGALAQAGVGVQVFRTVAAVAGDRGGRGGRGRGLGGGLLLDLLRAASQDGNRQEGNQQNAGGTVHDHFLVMHRWWCLRNVQRANLTTDF